MIRKLISRVFGGKSNAGKSETRNARSGGHGDSAAIIPIKNHGIRREQLSSGARRTVVIPMAQGQKQSRFIAWTFHDRASRSALLKAH